MGAGRVSAGPRPGTRLGRQHSVSTGRGLHSVGPGHSGALPLSTGGWQTGLPVAEVVGGQQGQVAGAHSDQPGPKGTRSAWWRVSHAWGVMAGSPPHPHPALSSPPPPPPGCGHQAASAHPEKGQMQSHCHSVPGERPGASRASQRKQVAVPLLPRAQAAVTGDTRPGPHQTLSRSSSPGGRVSKGRKGGLGGARSL